MDLRDKAVWFALLETCQTARTQLLDRAARCDDTEHAYARGKLEGLEHALYLLKTRRRALATLDGDVLADDD